MLIQVGSAIPGMSHQRADLSRPGRRRTRKGVTASVMRAPAGRGGSNSPGTTKRPGRPVRLVTTAPSAPSATGYGVDAATMSLDLHERGIHAV
jgi:hypothetical protein